MSPKHVTEAATALFSASEQTHCTLLGLSDCSFTQHVFEHPPKWLQRCHLVVTWLVPRETVAILPQFLCTPYNCAPVYSLTLFKATYVGCMCVNVTCHLHLWQNDQNILHATAVMWGWNGYQSKGQHNKLTLKNNIFPLLLLGLESKTF